MPILGHLKHGIPRMISNLFDMRNVDPASFINTLQLNINKGEGGIVLNQYGSNYIMLEGHLIPSDEIDIDLQFLNSDTLFLFVIEGCCTIRYQVPPKVRIVDELTSLSVSIKNNCFKSIQIEKQHLFSFHAVLTDKQKILSEWGDFSKKTIGNEPFVKVLDFLEPKVFSSNICLQMKEELKKIESINQENIFVCLLKTKSGYQLVLDIYLQLIHDNVYANIRPNGLTENELKTINSIAQYIIANPGLNHLQDNLCKRFYISQNKLQLGFRLIHKTTVANFTITVRLLKAAELMTEHHLTISEIVYSVGFKSRSYFNKIFRATYGVSPMTFRMKSLLRDRSLENKKKDPNFSGSFTNFFSVN